VTSSYSSPIEVLFKGNKLALRAAQGKWECSNASSVSTPTGTTVPTTTSTSAVHWKSAVLVGPDTVNGVPVWHVQQTGTDVVKGSKNQKTTEHFTGDYYIAQSDSTLTRASASIKSGTAKNGVVESGTVDLSSYREPVKITMPSACAKAKGKKSALLVAIAPAQLIKNPALMFDVLRRLAR
jgi:hypothetical protein